MLLDLVPVNRVTLDRIAPSWIILVTGMGHGLLHPVFQMVYAPATPVGMGVTAPLKILAANMVIGAVHSVGVIRDGMAAIVLWIQPATGMVIGVVQVVVLIIHAVTVITDGVA